MRTIIGLALATLLAGTSGAAAQVSDDAVRIGVMSDQNGVYSDVTGRGTIEAVKLAIADFGGKVLGKPIELVTGDDQTKPDVASAMARKWETTPSARAFKPESERPRGTIVSVRSR